LESLGAARYACLAALLCACFGSQTEAAAVAKAAPPTTGEVWIGIRRDNSAGKGTQSDPYDGSTQAKFDAWMTSIQPNNAIHLGPGTFVTQGIVPKSGWRLYLTSKTTLRLDVIASIPGQKWAIFGAGSPNSVGDVWIEGGIWDCNLQNQKIPLAAQAIAFAGGGGNITVKNITVINWGSTLAGAECFVVGVFNVGRTGKIAKNIVLDGIEVTQPAPLNHRASASLIGAHGQDPVNTKALSNGWLENVEIKNCYIHDIDIPVMTGSIQMGSWCHGVHIHHNRFENLGPKNDTVFGCYLDTGASENVLVEKNIFSGVVHGIFANLTTFDPVRNWVIRQNQILINRSNSSGGIELHGFNTTLRDVLVEENMISSLNGKSLTAYGIILSNVDRITISQNVIDDINGWAHIVSEKGVTGARVFKNRRRNGTPVQIKTRIESTARTF